MSCLYIQGYERNFFTYLLSPVLISIQLTFFVYLFASLSYYFTLLYCLICLPVSLLSMYPLFLLVLLSVCLSLCVSQAFTYYSRWYNSLSPTYMVTSYLSLFYLSISFMSPIRFFFITHVSAYPLYPYSLSLAN